MTILIFYTRNQGFLSQFFEDVSVRLSQDGHKVYNFSLKSRNYVENENDVLLRVEKKGGYLKNYYEIFKNLILIMKQKVFVIGFQKTGTTSLEHALQSLGYRVYGGDKNLMKFANTEDLKTYIKNTLKDWDAAQDMPWPLFYKELYEAYPDAKYILTIRDTDKWIRSVVTYFASVREPLHQRIYGVPCAEGYEDRYIELYEESNNKILEFFKDKPNFLVMEMGKNFNYQTLGNFLNLEDVPQEDFPHARNNKKRKLPNYKLYRDIRSIYWNYKKGY